LTRMLLIPEEGRPEAFDADWNWSAVQRALKDIDSPVDQHAQLLRNIDFRLHGRLDRETSLKIIGLCHQYIARGVPCRRDDAQQYAAACFLTTTPAKPIEDVAYELMRAYIRAGYFRLNDSTDAFGAQGYSSSLVPGRTNLEVAIRQGYWKAAAILVEEGESLSVAPFAAPDDLDSHTYGAADLLELSTIMWSEAHEGHALLRQASMRAQVRDAGTARATAPATQARRLRL